MRVLLSVLVVLAGMVASCQKPAKEELPEKSAQGAAKTELPEKIVQAWTDAGAQVGWLTVNKFANFRWEKQATAGSVLAFRFLPGKESVIANLPAPESPFGLNLGIARVTNAGLKVLAGLTSLTVLDLFDSQVTDAGLKELAGLKNLTALDLGSTQVTDAGLKELSSLTSLTTLGLMSTKVTDAGLKELAGLKNLTSLNLVGTKVTEKGMAELRKAMPKCLITG
ncbi:leucine-rich repeat domain-containing protein [Tuwongella immobilis]|uniref:F-box/LRR-repeat protein 15-like leucin rich repeat domain-containing protein n=1 Tax=Tuwongella immobilis TaxID=692036 RepID=A0A6C2YIS2_9BACT|nr:hypothetical protein [Tuwongella immobilis]VIP01181.1 Putative regulatory subunit OS=Gemmata sp. Wa1-1 PE=4 SV=1: LRR_4: LRR_6: LRR_6 [Tuwongella immobilis]VTR97788.1 Putative regulatory subunit OS=Gemmata sp. Wa1-1 PE=4 SV=1: LRR_4: LRR_6: LRR_6 [Tuwongella immobilis]